MLGRQLRSHPVIVMQAVPYRNRHEFAVLWLRFSQSRIGSWYAIQRLMNAAVIVPADEFGEYMPKMSFIPDQHSVKTLPAKRPYQPLYVCRRVGCAKRDRYPPNVHLLPEPLIQCRSTRQRLPFVSTASKVGWICSLTLLFSFLNSSELPR